MSDAYMTGRCLCGAVSYRLATRSTGFGACHCGMCRRWTGGVELGVEVPPGGIHLQGEEHLRLYASSDWAERGFCATCGSSLFWRLTAPGPMQGMMSLSAGSLDTIEGLELTAELFVDDKPAGYAFAGERPRLTGAEVLAMVEPASEGDAR